MPNLIDRVRSLLSPTPVPEAPDGNAEQLKSGKWATHQTIPVKAFPAELLLGDGDARLYGRVSEQIVLAQTRVGAHQVELLLWASGPKAVGLGLRIPTAPNQYKEPYLLMEAESGNTEEEAVREINFHLMGRVSEEDMGRVDWRAYFAGALKKLAALRALP